MNARIRVSFVSAVLFISGRFETKKHPSAVHSLSDTVSCFSFCFVSVLCLCCFVLVSLFFFSLLFFSFVGRRRRFSSPTLSVYSCLFIHEYVYQLCTRHILARVREWSLRSFCLFFRVFFFCGVGQKTGATSPASLSVYTVAWHASCYRTTGDHSK